MSLVRGLQCVIVFFLLLQHHGALSDMFCTGPEDCDKFTTHWAEKSLTWMAGYVVNLIKYMAANSESADGTPFITDGEFDTILDTVKDFFPEEPLKGPGESFFMNNVVRVVGDFYTDQWMSSEPESYDKLKSKLKAPLSTLKMSTHFLGGWLEKSDFSILRYPGQFLTGYANPILDFVIFFVEEAFDEALKGELKLTEDCFGCGILKHIQSMVYKGLRRMGGEFIDGQALKHSKIVGRGNSVYNRRFHVLMEELTLRKASKLHKALNGIAFHLESIINFLMVFSAVRDECYNGKDRLEYEVIQGGSQVDDQYLKAFMETADNAKLLACKYYKNYMGPEAEREVKFVYEEFHKVTNDTKASSDTLMIDAIAHNMLGDVEPACMLSFLCYAGFNRMKQESEGKRHPGVDLVLGITLSGRYSFNGLMDMNIMHKIGNTKMAEALHKGFNNDCGAYDVLKGCYDNEEFLNPGTTNQ